MYLGKFSDGIAHGEIWPWPSRSFGPKTANAKRGRKRYICAPRLNVDENVLLFVCLLSRAWEKRGLCGLVRAKAQIRVGKMKAELTCEGRTCLSEGPNRLSEGPNRYKRRPKMISKVYFLESDYAKAQNYLEPLSPQAKKYFLKPDYRLWRPQIR